MIGQKKDSNIKTNGRKMTKKSGSEKVSKTVKVDATIAPLLDYMLKKANIQLSDINDTFIRVWINQNMDLLTESEKKQFQIY
jgi:hypothetical protein